jgi:anaerobic selenocysteine-containing dehydrogenase
MRSATTIRTTCPRDCYDACGIVVKTSADGTINVVGDPDHHISRGALCAKCSIGYNGVWRDPDIRLTHPLRRVGPKGTGRFEPASWDEVLGAIAQRFNTILARDGGSAILHTHYTGTCSLIAGTFPLRSSIVLARRKSIRTPCATRPGTRRYSSCMANRRAVSTHALSMARNA